MTSSNYLNSNFTQTLLTDIKKFYKHNNQLNILLRETNNASKELKILQQSSQISDIFENFQLNEPNEDFIKSLSIKKVCFIVFGQNVLSKSIIVNELLSRYLIPFQTNDLDSGEEWRFIKIKYGKTTSFTYNLPDSDFEVMTNEQADKNLFSSNVSSISSKNEFDNHNSPISMKNPLFSSATSFTIPLEKLKLINFKNESQTAEKNDAREKIFKAESVAENEAILEVCLDHRLLEQNVEIMIYSKTIQKNFFEKLLENVIPVYIYGIIESKLNDTDIKELLNLKNILKNSPIFFLKIPDISSPMHPGESLISSLSYSTSKSFSLENTTQKQKDANNFLKILQQSSLTQSNNSLEIYGQLCEIKYLNLIPSGSISNTDYDFFDFSISLNNSSNCQNLIEFPLIIESEFCEKWHLFMPNMTAYLKRYLKSLSVYGTTALLKFHDYCLSKFINFAFEIARDMMITPRKIEYAREKEQILFENLISLASIKQEELKNLINNTIENNRNSILDACAEFSFIDVELVNVENENIEQSLLESNDNRQETKSSKFMTVKYVRDYKKCTNQIQELVISKLNNAIGQKLTESVEILKENYIGTLKRCLKTLEDLNNINKFSNEQNSSSVSEALQQILNSAYQVEVNLSGSSSLLKILLQKMKELIKNMPWSSTPKLDNEWKMTIASDMLNSLSDSKLAKIMCNQMKERLKFSHNQFISSLKILETKHNGRLEKYEEHQNLIRKILAPKFAKLSLESASLKDYSLYGFPILGKEIGRGQYGVVYSCLKWGKYEKLAVKSVVPPDEKHWNDLALEFHYTKQIADHERIVKLIGSVIDYTYGNGNSPAVLLIMEAMQRDLYQGLKVGIDWKVRLKISLDVVYGIRYLHGLGLVHRDIKLKNVLLDVYNRAKITDLGFCKPEAMMSGSIVGTPVHMCPEMFNSKYDNTVDIYAFGILFWYICSSTVSLPKNFEQCNTKDDLWSAVKRGVRPERLSNFDDDCWNLMEACWQHDPKQRPHIGVVAYILNKINIKYDAE